MNLVKKKKKEVDYDRIKLETTEKLFEQNLDMSSKVYDVELGSDLRKSKSSRFETNDFDKNGNNINKNLLSINFSKYNDFIEEDNKLFSLSRNNFSTIKNKNKENYKFSKRSSYENTNNINNKLLDMNFTRYTNLENKEEDNKDDHNKDLLTGFNLYESNYSSF